MPVVNDTTAELDPFTVEVIRHGLTAAAEEHMFVVWILLLVASAGVMEHSGIKIPFFAFFAHDSGKRPKEAPWNMLVAMGIAAFFCFGLGIAYPILYDRLPFECHYRPYTVTHVVTQLQLLMFAILAFLPSTISSPV